MSASDWAAWVGAVSGVSAVAWDVVRWLREGPRLLVHAWPNMILAPDTDKRPILRIDVVNRGTIGTTVINFGLFEFPSWLKRRRMRPSHSWVVTHDPQFGARLPQELQPGQQWLGGVRQDEGMTALIATGRMYVGVYHSFDPLRPVLAQVKLTKPMTKDAK